jgi:hypothetical protein
MKPGAVQKRVRVRAPNDGSDMMKSDRRRSEERGSSTDDELERIQATLYLSESFFQRRLKDATLARSTVAMGVL